MTGPAIGLAILRVATSLPRDPASSLVYANRLWLNPHVGQGLRGGTYPDRSEGSGMTHQVRTAFRRHRARTWGLAIVAIVLVAAIAIPIASSNSNKYYTLAYGDGSGAKTICTEDTVAVTLKLSNKAQSQSLGSADVTFPGSVVSVQAAPAPTTSKGTISSSGNKVSLRNLSLPATTGFVTFTVTVRADTVGANKPITAVAKQSNNFNDAGGEANLFQLKPGTSFPKLTVQGCYGTIDGTIWNDTNENGVTDGAAQEPRQGFQVFLYKKTDSDYVFVKSVTADGSTGQYTIPTVLLNKEYLVCERDPSAASWSQTVPPTASPPCEDKGNEANGYALNFTTSVTGKDFGNVAAVEPTCGSTFSGAALEGTFEYTAQLSLPDGVSACKSGDLVMFTYNSGSNLVATLHPIGNPGGAKYPVVERIRWDGLGSAQNPVTLYYDDAFPYDGADKRLMLECTSDPRDGSEFGLGPSPESVLTDDHTSCMIQSTDFAGGQYEAYVFSSVDGWKSTG